MFGRFNVKNSVLDMWIDGEYIASFGYEGVGRHLVSRQPESTAVLF